MSYLLLECDDDFLIKDENNGNKRLVIKGLLSFQAYGRLRIALFSMKNPARLVQGDKYTVCIKTP